ncbi:MAG: class I SAM-dependent methyltransferase, partial [Gemmatimonadaceae bacterium]
MSDPSPVEPNSRADWTARYAGGARRDEDTRPSRWVMEQSTALAPGSWVCDVAGGSGRHAAPLAARGCHVVIIDFVEAAVRTATRRAARVHGVVADVRTLPLKNARFDGIVVTNFLDRDLFPALIALLKPGGRLLYETYTTEHVALVAAGLAKSPRSARFLLKPGELRSLAAPLTIVAYREGDI